MNKKLFYNTVAQYKAKTVIGTDGVEWSGGAHCYLPSLKFYGGCSQSETPTPDAPIDIYSNTGTYILESDGRYIYLPNLRGIGEYRDEWDYATGKGLRYIHKVELDGVSDYKKAIKSALNNNTNVLACSITPEYTLVSNSSKKMLVSTHFYERWTSMVSGCVFSSDGKSITFGLDYSKIKSITEANIWLAEQYANGTPVTLYYALAEPIPFEERHEWDVYEPIPNESGNVFWGDGNIIGVPVEVTYITHS